MCGDSLSSEHLLSSQVTYNTTQRRDRQNMLLRFFSQSWKKKVFWVEIGPEVSEAEAGDLVHEKCKSLPSFVNLGEKKKDPPRNSLNTVEFEGE